jgi:hypothetical protein
MQAIESTTEPEGPEHGARRTVDPLRNVARICLVFFALAFIGFFGSVLWQLHQRADPTWAVPNDVSVFWAAAKLALAGAPARAFDLHALTAARNLPPGLPPSDLRMSWSYPPQFLVLVLPLGLMPYAAAWLVWAVAGVAAFWLAMRRLLDDPSIVVVTCASLAVLMCAIQGQNSLIVAAGLVWAAPTLGHFAREAGMAYAFSLLTPPILTAFLVLILREVALARTDAAG